MVKVSLRRIRVKYANALMVKLPVPPKNVCHHNQTAAEELNLLSVSVVLPLSARNKNQHCQRKHSQWSHK